MSYIQQTKLTVLLFFGGGGGAWLLLTDPIEISNSVNSYFSQMLVKGEFIPANSWLLMLK